MCVACLLPREATHTSTDTDPVPSGLVAPGITIIPVLHPYQNLLTMDTVRAALVKSLLSRTTYVVSALHTIPKFQAFVSSLGQYRMPMKLPR